MTEAANFPHSILLLSQKSNDYLFAMWVFQQSLLKAFSGFHQVSKQMFNQAQGIKPKALQVSSIVQLSSNSGKASSYLRMLSNNHFFTNLWKKRFTSNHTMSTDRSSVKLNCSFRYNSYSSRLHFVFNLFQWDNFNDSIQINWHFQTNTIMHTEIEPYKRYNEIGHLFFIKWL